MANNSRDIQLIELKDMISQLNTTIKVLNETVARQQAENGNLRAELTWFRQKFSALPARDGPMILPVS